MQRIARAGSAPNILQHIVNNIIRNESPPFIGGAFWNDFVVSRRRHLNARQQYERFPFEEDIELAALGDFRYRIAQWAMIYERRSHSHGARTVSVPFPAFPWYLPVERVGIRDGTTHVGHTNAVFVADPARPNDDASLPIPCTVSVLIVS